MELEHEFLSQTLHMVVPPWDEANTKVREFMFQIDEEDGMSMRETCLADGETTVLLHSLPMY